MKTFAIAGCGHLGRIVKKAYEDGLLEGYSLTALFSRKTEDALALAEGTGARVARSMDEIIQARPDYIVETASIALLKDFAYDSREERDRQKQRTRHGRECKGDACEREDAYRHLALCAYVYDAGAVRDGYAEGYDAERYRPDEHLSDVKRIGKRHDADRVERGADISTDHPEYDRGDEHSRERGDKYYHGLEGQPESPKDGSRHLPGAVCGGLYTLCSE